MHGQINVMLSGQDCNIQEKSNYPNTGYPDLQLSISAWSFLLTFSYYIFLWLKFFPQLSIIYKKLCFKVLFVRK